MTLASDIISAAYRESNIIPLGVSPTTAQTTEALDRLNNILLSTLGNEVGDGLNDINIGGDFDQSDWCSPYVPDDTRLVFNLSAATTLVLDPSPYEGQRLSFVDVGGNLATYNVTLDGNGRNVEGGATLTLSTNGDSRNWLYRADTGNWVKLVVLADSDTMPLPSEFDDYFITMLVMRMNPRYGQNTTQETVEALKRMRGQIRSRYHNYRQVRPDLDTRGFLSDPNGIYRISTSMSDFNIGRPFSWLR
jgi:hypothetical protein